MRWFFCCNCHRAIKFKDQEFKPIVCPICKSVLLKEMDVK